MTAEESGYGGAQPSPGAGIGKGVVVGLLGAGIQLSRTPLMHEVEGARQGLRYIYKLLDTDTPAFSRRSLADIIWAAEAAGFAGLNVTFPYKQAALAHLDALSENASRLGAVNTIVFREGKRFGHNTDLYGFAEGFRRNMSDVPRDRVLQMGAGGAGSAVAQALMQLGVAHLVISDVDSGRAHELAAKLAAQFGTDRATARHFGDVEHERFDGLVNATPIGMAKSPGMAVPASFLNAEMWVADIIYFPLETELLRAAGALGARTLSGEPMAIFQAVRALELFTGLKADPQAMKVTFASFNKGGLAPVGKGAGDAA
ncbi:shikimate dehydrogenase [Neorhizobium sp. LjRoot104]|uniref:shikimate dehydrogenase n=1 Tax=Neorhizobium sp. LjRoot104 TaxID=3342254 RepID=UPI003ECF8B0C